MAPFKPILIDGKSLVECSLEEILEHNLRPSHKIHSTSDRAPYYRNVDLLRCFGRRRRLSTSEFVERYRCMDRVREAALSHAFDCHRATELLRWALDERMVERQGDEWRLLVPEMVFEMFGRVGLHDWAVRVRRLPTPEAQAEADKLWDREQKRVERLRVSRAKELRKDTERHLDTIERHDPGRVLPKHMKRFRIAGCTTFAEVRELILDAIVTIPLVDAQGLRNDCLKESLDASANRKSEPPIPEADLDAIANMVI